jgi:hypothetical protein
VTFDCMLCCATDRKLQLALPFLSRFLSRNYLSPRNSLQTLYIFTTDLFQERAVPAFLSHWQVQDSRCVYPFRPVSPWESGWSPVTGDMSPDITGHQSITGSMHPWAPEDWNGHGEPCLNSSSAAVIMGICARTRITHR